MQVMNDQQSEREARRARADRDELIERIARAVRDDGAKEPLPGLRLHRSSSPTELAHVVYNPAFCVIAQGSKEVFLGEDRYQYDPAHYLLATIELPVVSQVIEASRSGRTSACASRSTPPSSARSWSRPITPRRAARPA